MSPTPPGLKTDECANMTSLRNWQMELAYCSYWVINPLSPWCQNKYIFFFHTENIHVNVELFFVLFPPCVCACVYQESEVTWSQFRPVESPPICTWTVYPWEIPTPPPGSAPHPAPPSSAPVSCRAAVERSTLLSRENRFFHDGLTLGLVEALPMSHTLVPTSVPKE